MSKAQPSYAVLIEPRRIYALGETRGRRVLREEPLAYYALPEGVALSGSDWSAVEDDRGVYLTGNDALLVAEQLADSCDAVYPLLDPELAFAPPVAWEALSEIVSRLLTGTDRRIVTIVPTQAEDASNLWLHALPETLLADLEPDYGIVNGANTLLDGDRRSGVTWGWVVGEVGISVAATYEGRDRETFVPRRATPGLGNEELTLLGLIERAFSASLALFKDAWSTRPDPQILIRFATTPAEARATESALARVVTKLGLGSDFRGERFSLTELLERALSSEPPISS